MHVIKYTYILYNDYHNNVNSSVSLYVYDLCVYVVVTFKIYSLATSKYTIQY